jgi:Glycine/D-amino acid oxidases (deaminating)
MALKHNSGKTWYELTAGKPPATEKLKKDVTCDVCVVGGGLTGVVAALRLAEAGKQVVLLDAGQIGDGASGRSGAPLLAGINEPLTAVIDIIGESAAEELWRHTINGRQALLNRIKKHNIDCDFTEGVIYVARTEKQKRQLEHKADFHDRRFGKEYLEFMDTAEVNEAVRSPLYVAGAKAKRAGHFHPLKFLYGPGRSRQRSRRKNL